VKVLPFKIPKPEQDALVFQEDKELVFYDKLHQHEEIQLSLILEGEGTLIVGDTVNYYGQGDIIIIGSNLPHVFKSDVNASSKSHMLSLFFTKTSFGADFFKLEELQELRLFFKRTAHGFKITSSKKAISSLFFELKQSSKFERFIILLKLLKIASTSSYKSLSSFIYEKKYNDNEGKRMRDVFEYTMTHYEKDISLEAIAEVAAMTKNAFCKYFKRRTNKTYFRFLNELRIEHASKLLLVENNFSIAEIAERSGFNNISNFNRQFKAVKQVTPSGYKI
jgi:AraC-like DNA-binding protein